MNTHLLIIGAALLLSACAQKTAYEAAVEDMEPTYCYKSLGGITCYAKPFHRDERRLVNYYGPAPIRYDRPEVAPEPNRSAPAQIKYWVKDPEPLPTISAKGNLADRPWLVKMTKAEKAAHQKKGLEVFLSNIQKNAKADIVAPELTERSETF